MAEANKTIGGIPLTENNYLSLRKVYRKAVTEKQEEFVWEGHEWVTDYIKYVLELMEREPLIKPLKDQADD